MGNADSECGPLLLPKPLAFCSNPDQRPLHPQWRYLAHAGWKDTKLEVRITELLQQIGLHEVRFRQGPISDRQAACSKHAASKQAGQEWARCQYLECNVLDRPQTGWVGTPT